MNALMRKLESDRGKIRGMKMLYPINGTSLFQVKVTGIDFNENKLAVKITPQGGVGEIGVAPSELVDDTPKDRDLYFRRFQADKYVRENSRYHHTLTAQRNATTNEIRDLEKKHPKKVKELVGDMDIRRQESYSIRALFRQLANLRFGLSPDNEPLED